MIFFPPLEYCDSDLFLFCFAFLNLVKEGNLLKM